VGPGLLWQLGGPLAAGTGSAADPSLVQDVFFRIGGATAGSATDSLVVNSSDVVLEWPGGEDIFFQNEMPHDPPSQAAWMSGPAIDGYPAFLISAKVKGFSGYGMGSYCLFNQGVPIESATAFSVPDTGVQLNDVLTRFLNGSGSIDHVVNDTGAGGDH
jgi:hypothetical protein